MALSCSALPNTSSVQRSRHRKQEQTLRRGGMENVNVNVNACHDHGVPISYISSASTEVGLDSRLVKRLRRIHSQPRPNREEGEVNSTGNKEWTTETPCGPHRSQEWPLHKIVTPDPSHARAPDFFKQPQSSTPCCLTICSRCSRCLGLETGSLAYYEEEVFYQFQSQGAGAVYGVLRILSLIEPT